MTCSIAHHFSIGSSLLRRSRRGSRSSGCCAMRGRLRAVGIAVALAAALFSRRTLAIPLCRSSFRQHVSGADPARRVGCNAGRQSSRCAGGTRSRTRGEAAGRGRARRGAGDPNGPAAAALSCVSGSSRHRCLRPHRAGANGRRGPLRLPADRRKQPPVLSDRRRGGQGHCGSTVDGGDQGGRSRRRADVWAGARPHPRGGQPEDGGGERGTTKRGRRLRDRFRRDSRPRLR